MIMPGNNRLGRRVHLSAFLIVVLASVPASVWSRETLPSASSQPYATAPGRAEHPSSLTVGERLTFHGQWMGIPIGHGWIEVKELMEVAGHPVYHIEAQGHSNAILSAFYPIHDVVHSYVEAQTLRPLRFEKHQREGRYRADEIVTFDYASGTALYQSLLNGSVKEIPLPSKFQDLISALYWFRLQPLPAPSLIQGGQLTIDLYTDEKIYQTTIMVKPPVPLALVERGTFSCLVVEPLTSFQGLLVKRGRLWAYVTADERRLPVLVKATTPWGPMSAVLDEASSRQLNRPVW